MPWPPPAAAERTSVRVRVLRPFKAEHAINAVAAGRRATQDNLINASNTIHGCGGVTPILHQSSYQ
jgi:hypothetical protein